MFLEKKLAPEVFKQKFNTTQEGRHELQLESQAQKGDNPSMSLVPGGDNYF